MTSSEFVRVAPELGLDRLFDYRIPEALQGRIRLGQRLRVAWGPPGGGPDGTGPTSARIKAAHVAAHPEDAGTPGLPAAPGA